MVYFKNFIIKCGLCGGSTIGIILEYNGELHMVCHDCGIDRIIEPTNEEFDDD